MWGEVLDWLLLFMAPNLVHHELHLLKPLCQSLVIAEIPPLFSASLDGIPPHNPMGDILPKKKKLLLLTIVV